MERVSIRTPSGTFPAYAEGEGPLVLCLHGFPDHARTWRLQLPALAAAGYRAVAPEMRGYSTQTQTGRDAYYVIDLAQDVFDLLDALGERSCHLIGHDWGAVVTYAASAMGHGRIRSASTLAVPYLRHVHWGLARYPLQLRNSWYMLFFQLRGVAEQAVRRDDFAFLERLWQAWSPGWRYPPEEMRALKETFRQEGVVEAALGYYRGLFRMMDAENQASRRYLRRKLRVPLLALTGDADGCMDTRLYDVLFRDKDFLGGLDLWRIQQAGHFLHQEKPEIVNDLLVDWITRHEEAAVKH